MNNASSSDDTVSAYVVCGLKPGKYIQVLGAQASVPSHGQGPAAAACPTGTVIFGGGDLNNNDYLDANLNSSAPSGTTGWIAYENNASGGFAYFKAYAVCGKATTSP